MACAASRPDGERLPRAELNGSRLSHRADDAAAGPGDQDAGQHLPRLGRSRLGYVEGPDADAGVDQQAELGDGEAGSGAHPGDEAEQGEVADAERQCPRTECTRKPICLVL